MSTEYLKYETRFIEINIYKYKLKCCVVCTDFCTLAYTGKPKPWVSTNKSPPHSRFGSWFCNFIYLFNYLELDMKILRGLVSVRGLHRFVVFRVIRLWSRFRVLNYRSKWPLSKFYMPSMSLWKACDPVSKELRNHFDCELHRLKGPCASIMPRCFAFHMHITSIPVQWGVDALIMRTAINTPQLRVLQQTCIAGLHQRRCEDTNSSQSSLGA